MMPIFRVFSSGTSLAIKSCNLYNNTIPSLALIVRTKTRLPSSPLNERIRTRRIARRIVDLGVTTSRLDQGFHQDQALPAVMGKSLIGFSHAVRVIPLLDGSPAVVRGVQKLCGNPFDHRLLSPLAGIADQPAKAQGSLAIAVDLDRHLVVRTTHSSGLHFQGRLHIVNGLLEDF